MAEFIRQGQLSARVRALLWLSVKEDIKLRLADLEIATATRTVKRFR